jgi:IS5 family transposase
MKRLEGTCIVITGGAGGIGKVSAGMFIDEGALVNELLGAKGLLLRAGTVVDATLIAAPSSTKKASGERDPEIKQSQKGHADSGLAHTVRGTAGSVNDVVQANTLLHGQETEAWGDAGWQGAETARRQRKACAGTSPCARASTSCWTGLNWSKARASRLSASRPASGPRSSTRFG